MFSFASKDDDDDDGADGVYLNSDTDLRLARAGISDYKNRVPHCKKLFQLNHFQNKIIFCLKLQLKHRLFNNLLKKKINKTQASG